MRLLALLVLATVSLAAAPAAPSAGDIVIYPRPEHAPPAAAREDDGWSRAPWLAGALILAAGGAWWLRHSRPRGTPAGRAGGRLAIAETRSLGNRQYLVVAVYAGKKLLLGVTPGRIRLLCELPEAGEEEP
ncbi:MAG: flagellar biosynthetic protein FliO [Opitutaceae bacterium]|nr:flagellar biosynthetic protein FliO [Opitutaceae bacterium]